MVGFLNIANFGNFVVDKVSNSSIWWMINNSLSKTRIGSIMPSMGSSAAENGNTKNSSPRARTRSGSQNIILSVILGCSKDMAF